MENQPARQRSARGADVSRLRISDEDRHRVSEVLRQAAGEGRIDLTELDERLEATYRAKTYADLVPLTADLPVAAGQPPNVPPVPPPVPQPVTLSGEQAPGSSVSVAVMSNSRRTGTWVVSDTHTAFALMGTVVLDLRRAHIGSPELTINASAVMGEVKVVVGAGTRVLVEGFGVMGDFSEQRPKVPFDPSAGGPLVRVRGLALMGSVAVQRKGPPSAAALEGDAGS
ncbi:MAG: hypothetical protein QOF53_2544 [Nocardioidaceae bacterium]|nr:hypothetical protein [Nocardioidaceae bacterium]